MNYLIQVAMTRLQEFSVLDVGIFKICLICFGILLGAYNAKFAKKTSPVLIGIFIASYIYLIFKFFFSKEDQAKYL